MNKRNVIGIQTIKRWRVSCPKFTVLVVTSGPVIIEAAPLVRRFIGQPLTNLTMWATLKSGSCDLTESGGK